MGLCTGTTQRTVRHNAVNDSPCTCTDQISPKVQSLLNKWEVLVVRKRTGHWARLQTLN